MKTFIATITLFVAAIVPVKADDWAVYRVTITNATTHHVITPPLITTHNNKFRIFEVTAAASDGLVTQAETGDPRPLKLEVVNSRGVYDVVEGSDVVLYGTSANYDIRAPKKGRISMTAMLATTNDAFTALNSVALPKRSAQYFAYTYDAGSELNNESCSHIPGPPCSPESGNARTETGEGFITLHNGIQGGSDLNPKQLDWRGPVAVVTITRVHDE